MKVEELEKIMIDYIAGTEVHIVDNSNYPDSFRIVEVTDCESDGSMQIHIIATSRGSEKEINHLKSNVFAMEEELNIAYRTINTLKVKLYDLQNEE